MNYRILIVDDEPEWLDILQLLFARKGWRVDTASDGYAAWERLGKAAYDLVLCDLVMPAFSGMDLLKRIRGIDPALPFVMMTGVGTIETAVEAVQNGAYSYIAKPFKNEELKALAQRAIEHGRLIRQLTPDGGANEKPVQILGGAGKAMRQVLRTVAKVADSPVPVLIQGETGTGKSVLAVHIHRVSSRRDKPFVTIDCGALPETLLESELFGHVKGAFTGAVCTRRGLLEEAQNGTVFLDEVGEISLATQVKLLRAIQEHEIRPVGGNKPVSVDVRFITATNRNLLEDVAAGRFREDLYYRLAVIPIELPPLRERTEDLCDFIAYFLKKFNERYGKSVKRVSPASMPLLYSCPWKGNVRELENVLERAVLLTTQEELTPETLGFAASPLPSAPTPACAGPSLEPLSLHDAVREAERRAISNALARTGGNRKQAAELLGIGRRTLYDKLGEYNLGERNDD